MKHTGQTQSCRSSTRSPWVGPRGPINSAAELSPSKFHLSVQRPRLPAANANGRSDSAAAPPHHERHTEAMDSSCTSGARRRGFPLGRSLSWLPLLLSILALGLGGVRSSDPLAQHDAVRMATSSLPRKLAAQGLYRASSATAHLGPRAPGNSTQSASSQVRPPWRPRKEPSPCLRAGTLADGARTRHVSEPDATS